MRYFQLYNLFDTSQLDAILGEPRWATKYPEMSAARRSADELIRSRVLVPDEVVLAIARECQCVGDLYADPDGQTLHIVPPGNKPFRIGNDARGKVTVSDIQGAVKLTPERAIQEYGADAVWLAQEYGKSRRGEISSFAQ